MLRRFVLPILLFFVPAVFGQVPPPPVPPAATQAAADHSQESYVIEKFRTSYRFEYDFVTITSTPLAAGQFWMEYEFLKAGTVLDEQLQLDVPKDRIIKLKTKPGNDPKITEANGRRVYAWSSSHVDKDEDDKKKDKEKEKKARKEPDAPAVQMTTFSSWE